MNANITYENKATIVALHTQGLNISQIADETGFTVSKNLFLPTYF